MSGGQAALPRAGWRPEKLASPWTVALVILIAWEAAILLFEIPPFLLPSLLAVLETLVDQRALLLKGLLTTGAEIIAAFLISLVCGVALGILAARSRLFQRTFLPLLIAAQAIPTLAAAPLLVVWFGFGWLPKIIIAVMITFFPIMMGTAQGLRSLDPALLDMARTLGLRGRDRLWKVQAPAALPALFGGLRVASTLVVVGAVVGEFVGSSAGLGYVLLRATGTIDTPLLFAALFLLIALGLALTWLIALAERRAMPWRFEAL